MKDFVKGTLLLAGGMVIGATVALLFAPQSGEETRKQLGDLAQEAKKRVSDYCEQVKENIEQIKESAAPAPEKEA